MNPSDIATEAVNARRSVIRLRRRGFVALALTGLLIIEVRNIDASQPFNSFLSGIAMSFVGVWVVAAVLESLYLAYSKSAIENTINEALSAVADTQTGSPSPAREVSRQ